MPPVCPGSLRTIGAATLRRQCNRTGSDPIGQAGVGTGSAVAYNLVPIIITRIRAGALTGLICSTSTTGHVQIDNFILGRVAAQTKAHGEQD